MTKSLRGPLLVLEFNTRIFSIAGILNNLEQILSNHVANVEALVLNHIKFSLHLASHSDRLRQAKNFIELSTTAVFRLQDFIHIRTFSVDRQNSIRIFQNIYYQDVSIRRTENVGFMPGGRPPIEIDETQLKALMRMKPTLEDTAAFFECNARTIERYIRENFDLSFVEFRDKNMVHTRLNLIRKAIQMADGGNVPMLIFTLKNLCGWKDRQPDEAPDVLINNANISARDLSSEELDQKLRARGIDPLAIKQISEDNK